MLSVQVRRANGEVLGKAAIDPQFNPVLFGIDGTTYPMLSTIDPYGDTVFNYLQVKRLLTELEGYAAGAVNLEGFVEKLKELCEMALSGPHRFLWFVGD